MRTPKTNKKLINFLDRQKFSKLFLKVFPLRALSQQISTARSAHNGSRRTIPRQVE